MKKKKSKALLASAILGVAYAIYIVWYFFNATTSQNDLATTIGAGIATAVVMPHMICVILAVIFNIIGWAGNIRWSALVGGIMYAVAAILFVLYAPFVLLQIILSFIGFSKLKKINESNKNDSIDPEINSDNDSEKN